jgi:hypothetical protein
MEDEKQMSKYVQGIMLHLVYFSSERLQNVDGLSKEPAVGRCAHILSLLRLFEFYDTAYDLHQGACSARRMSDIFSFKVVKII